MAAKKRSANAGKIDRQATGTGKRDTARRQKIVAGGGGPKAETTKMRGARANAEGKAKARVAKAAGAAQKARDKIAAGGSRRSVNAGRKALGKAQERMARGARLAKTGRAKGG